MSQDLVLFPMGALALLTFLVLFFVPVHRVRGGGKLADLGESASVPSRNHASLLEMPVLFYAICLMAFVTNRVDNGMLLFAWTYVGLRALHSAVHLSYNAVLHRLTLFALSNLVLMAMWVLFFLGV